MFSFLVFWSVALIIFLVLTLLCDPQKRKRFLLRLRTCQWSDDLPDDSTNEQFHYKISKEQEDEIRESFLLESLRMYSMTLDASKIQPGLKMLCTSSYTDSSTCDDETHEEEVVTPPPRDEEEIVTPPPRDEEAPCDEVTQDTDEYTGDEPTLVRVPVPGAQCQTQFNRNVPNGCAICLCAFESNDQVCWSSNPECTHVFHHACIIDWLKTSGRKHLKRRRRQEERSGAVSHSQDPVERIIDFPKLCPCCRQDFILESNAKNETKTAQDSSTTGDEPAVVVGEDNV